MNDFFGDWGDQWNMKDKLVMAVLSGAKTMSSSLRIDYDAQQKELPKVSQIYDLIDSQGEKRGQVEIDEVRILPLGHVTMEIVTAEGEGFATIEDWRREHLRVWLEEIPEIQKRLGLKEITLTDDSQIVVETFHLIKEVS